MDTWLDATDHPQRELRRTLLAEHRAEVFQCAPGGDRAALTVAAHIASHCQRELCGADAPLAEAALMVRDDLCVLARQEQSWNLVAAVVCFPSRWRLADKMGRDVVGIHDPVPDYRQRLGGPTDKVLASLSPRWRVNWTLLDDPRLFQPAPPATPLPGPTQSWYLRVERQCLVPVGEYVAFTIRTDVVALADLEDEQREALLRSAATAPAELARYRGWASR